MMPTTIHVHDDPGEWCIEEHRSFVRIVASRLGLSSDAGRTEILDRIHDLTRGVTIQPTAICPGVDFHGDGRCRDHNATGCQLVWDEMTPAEVDAHGHQLGDEDEVRMCECGLAWIAVRCKTCRAEYDRLIKGDDAYHAGKEESAA